MMAMKDYILQAQPPASRPLFMFSQSDSWLAHSSPTKELLSILQQCGFPSNNFDSHCFRIGDATSAASAGISAWLIKVLGRWSSDCYDLYIKTPQSTFLTIPKLLISRSNSRSVPLPDKLSYFMNRAPAFRSRVVPPTLFYCGGIASLT